MIILLEREVDPRIRGCLVVALAQIGGDEIKKPILDSFAREKDERVRCLIVTAIGLLCDDSSLHVLTLALRDDNPRVRANAVEALARVKGVNPGELVKKLLNDPNNRVRANVCKVLWFSDPQTVLNSLKEMVSSEREMERASAAYAMGEIGDPGLLPLLIEQIKIEKGPKAREHICVALGKLGDSALAPLKDVLALENNLNVLFALQEINRKRREKR
jgi:HEAT repeat protein